MAASVQCCQQDDSDNLPRHPKRHSGQDHFVVSTADGFPYGVNLITIVCINQINSYNQFFKLKKAGYISAIHLVCGQAAL
jgi:hypothetical protein